MNRPESTTAAEASGIEAPDFGVMKKTTMESQIVLAQPISQIPQLPGANDIIVETPIRTPKQRRLRSVVWNDMTKQPIGDGRYFAICNHCQKKMPGNSATGTTHLLKHLKFCQEFKNSKKRRTSKRKRTTITSQEKKTQDGTFSEPKRRKLRSMVWNEMTREYKADGSGYFAVCNHCKKKIACSNESGTTHLMNHLRVCPSYKNSSNFVPKEDKAISLQKKIEEKIVHPIPRRRKLRSEVWKNMTKEERGDGSYFATCIHCNKKLLGNNRRGTTQFLNHLRFCDAFKRAKGFAIGGSDRFEFDQDRSRKAFARMVILHDYPFSIVDHAGLIKFLNSLQPRFQLMSPDVVREDCIKVYEEERKKLQEMLLKGRSKVNLAVTQCLDYYCLCCHFVGDDWRLRKRILSFGKLGSRSEVLRVVEVAASDWLIWDKVGSVVLEEYSHETEIALREPVIFQCWAHTLDALMDDCLKVNAVNELLERVRGSMMGASSPLNWRSTLETLEAALRELFSDLSDVDRINVRAVVDFLTLSRGVKLKLSWSKKPAINYLFRDLCYLCVKLKEWCNGPGPIKPMAERMLEKLAAHLIHASPLLAIGNILDPRFKMKCVDFFFDQVYHGNRSEMMKNIRGAFLKMFNEYEEKCNEISARPEKSDVDFYLDDDVIIIDDDDGFDVLAWWMHHSERFPVLSMMARDILSIPVSAGVLTLNMGVDFKKRWTDLETVEILICAKDWLRGEMEEVIEGEIGDGFSSVFLAAIQSLDEEGGLG